MADQKAHLLALLGTLKSDFQGAAEKQDGLFKTYGTWRRHERTVDTIIAYVSKAPSLQTLYDATDVDNLVQGGEHRDRVQGWANVFARWASSEYAKPAEASAFKNLSDQSAAIVQLLPTIR